MSIIDTLCTKKNKTEKKEFNSNTRKENGSGKNFHNKWDIWTVNRQLVRSETNEKKKNTFMLDLNLILDPLIIILQSKRMAKNWMNWFVKEKNARNWTDNQFLWEKSVFCILRFGYPSPYPPFLFVLKLSVCCSRIYARWNEITNETKPICTNICYVHRFSLFFYFLAISNHILLCRSRYHCYPGCWLQLIPKCNRCCCSNSFFSCDFALVSQ